MTGPQLRATRCPDCKRITMAVREGVRCRDCREARANAVYMALLESRKRKAPRVAARAVVSERANLARAIREEAARRGVPKCVVRTEIARAASESHQRPVESVTTHIGASQENAATDQL